MIPDAKRQAILLLAKQGIFLNTTFKLAYSLSCSLI